jgi:L-alanine-DL-glutamate epimerase-like enolase superfamily enzyme
MKATFEHVEHPLEHPFTIARGTQTTARSVVVRLEHGGTVGVGGANPASHYGETPETVAAVLPRLFDALPDDPLALQRADEAMHARVRDNPAAKAAVDIALHDLAAKTLDVPLYRLLGLDPERTLTSSFTIGLADIDEMREKTEAAVDAGYSVLKVKVGTGRDEAVVRTVREAAPSARIRVDANEDWTPKEAVQTIEAIADYDVEFVEQPVPAEDPAGLRYVYERSPLPIAADESCITLPDIPAIADRADIAVLKLMKTGGIREAVRMVHAARAHGLEVMLGCMTGTNAAMAAACHLAPLLDYADLDGSLLLAEDTFAGVPMPGGRIDLPDRPGTGARER